MSYDPDEGNVSDIPFILLMIGIIACGVFIVLHAIGIL